MKHSKIQEAPVAGRSGDQSGSAPGVPGARRPRTWLRWVGLVAVAWLVPNVTHLAHVDWILPVLIWLGTASLVRAGSSLLDRLMISLAVLIGATCAAGLLWSVWPFGLEPVAIAGSALSALVLSALVSGRQPVLPRPAVFDAVAVTAAGGAAVVMAWPFLRAHGLGDQLGVLMSGDDNSRHLATVDAIRAGGGYLFVDPHRVADIAPTNMIYVPQGWHLVAGVLDGFVRSSASLGTGSSAVTHYGGWSAATFGLLVLFFSWAAVWIAGRQLDLVRRIAVAGAVVSIVVGSEITRTVFYGYRPEMLALGLFAALTAVLARPASRIREQFVVIACLLVGIGFVYYFFLPPAGVAIAIWLVRYRRPSRRHWVSLVLIGGLATLLASTPVWVGLTQPGGTPMLTYGGVAAVAYDGLIALGALVGAGLVAGGLLRRRPRIAPVWRGYVWTGGVVAAFCVAITVQNLTAGKWPTYYYGKTLHLLLAVLAVGIGAVALLAPPPWRTLHRRGRQHRITAAITAAILVLALAAASGVLFGHGMFARRYFGDGESQTYTSIWLRQYGSSTAFGRVVAEVDRRYPSVPGTMSVIVSGKVIYSYTGNEYLSALQRQAGVVSPGVYNLGGEEPARLLRLVTRNTGRIRLILIDDGAVGVVEHVFRETPDLATRVGVVRLPGVPAPKL